AITDPTHTFPGGGTYTVTLTGISARGCEETVVKQVGIPDLMEVTQGIINPTICFGDCSGSASVSVINGTPPFSYLWSDPAMQTTPTATNLCAGTYMVTISDSFGCVAQDSVIIPDGALLVSTPFTTDAYCGGLCFGTADANPSGGSAPYSFAWSDGQTAQTATSLCPGTYTVLITDANGCTTTNSATVLFSNNKPATNAGTASDTIYLGQSTYLFSTGNANYAYSWQPPFTLGTPNEQLTLATPESNTNYIVTVTDSNGCTNSDTIRIIVRRPDCIESELFVPNAFTPNGDNNNDVMYVRGDGFSEIFLRVYNRWGELLFETKDKNVGWDGIYKSKPVPPGVYVYYIKVICWGEETFEKKGNVTVIR
ncbi:MAG: T9SS type B sorting domain-containing protein, partial [Bacteroidia bacterium]|nr:T9SS type B sorting domain-containing protein [Bacteroidia bacterium]